MAIIRKFSFLVALILSSIASLHAQNQPLLVAIPQFVAPFIMSAKDQLYGFDISMMDEICTIIHRDCKYKITPFNQLLQSVVDKKTDIAMGSITITAERAKIVNFSKPYMLSETRFIGKKSMKNTPINLDVLKKSKIGIIKGTIFSDELESMGVDTLKLSTFNNQSDIMEALITGSIDLGLVGNATAHYWQSQSNEALVALGKAIPYGSGIGIAVNIEQTALLESINQAIDTYQNSPNFTRNYNLYLNYF